MRVIQPSMEFCDSLTDLPLFASLGREQRMALLKCAEVVGCDKGELFFRHGEPAESFLILKTGRVKMRRLSPSGNEVVLHLAAPPHMIGCKGLTLPGSTYPADAVAVEIACNRARELGAKKTVPLPVSAPFHCALMEPAAQKLEGELAAAAAAAEGAPVLVDPQAVIDIVLQHVPAEPPEAKHR